MLRNHSFRPLVHWLEERTTPSLVLGNAMQFGGVGDETAHMVHADEQGNVYLLGTFEGTVDFDPGPGVFEMTCMIPNSDATFLVKLNAANQLVWARSWGPAGEVFNDLDVDVDGNVYLVGDLGSPGMDMDPGIGFQWMPVNGGDDGFMLKLDAQGAFVSYAPFETFGTNSAFIEHVAVDRLRNVYISGEYRGNMDPNPDPVTVTLLPAVPEDECEFVLKLNPLGKYEWIRQIASDDGTPLSTADEWISDLCVDSFNRPVAVVGYEGTLYLGATPVLMAADNQDAVILQWDPMGNLLWGGQVGGNKDDGVRFVEPAENGALIITGQLYGESDLDPDPAKVKLVQFPDPQGFIARINADHTLGWLRYFSGPLSSSYVGSPNLTSTGDIITGVSVLGKVDFGPGIATFGTAGDSTSWLVRVSPTGELVHRQESSAFWGIWGAGWWRNELAIGPNDELYYADHFGLAGQSSIDVDPGAGERILTTRGEWDIALVRLDERATVRIAAASGQASPATSSPIIFKVTFDLPVTGFAASDIVLSGSANPATATISGSGKTYIVRVSGMTQNGDVRLSIPASKVTTLGGNPNLASNTMTIAYELSAPTVTIVPAAVQPNPATGKVVFNVTFSRPVTGFVAADVVLSGSANPRSVTISGTGPSYTVTVGGMLQSGSVTITIPADAVQSSDGFGNLAAVPATIPYQRPPGSVDHAFVVGSGAGMVGTVTIYNADSSVRAEYQPFGDFTGGVRVACGDVNGDGIADLIVGTGPGRSTLVRVIDGSNPNELIELHQIEPFEGSFLGGVYVAAGDIDGDGHADIIITPDQGGGPRVRIISGADFHQITDFFGIDDTSFRGGARAALGDVTGDGHLDLLVAAGFGGGPRLAVFDGKSVVAALPDKPFGDFFVFEQGLRNGVFIASGDLNDDGYAEVIAGGGPGGGPRVFALSGHDLMMNVEVPLANFFAGDVNNRGGVRLVAHDLDGDDHADIITGAGEGGGNHVSIYAGAGMTADTPPDELHGLDAIPNFSNGLFVG